MKSRHVILFALACLSLPILFGGCANSPGPKATTVTSVLLEKPVAHVRAAAKLDVSSLSVSEAQQALSGLHELLRASYPVETPVYVIYLFDNQHPIWETMPASYSNYQCSALVTIDKSMSEAGKALLTASVAGSMQSTKYFYVVSCGGYLDLSGIKAKAEEIAKAEREGAAQEAKTADQSSSNKQPAPKPKTLGYGFEEFMRYLSNTFPSMEFQPLPDGRDQFVGQSVNGLGILYLVGDSHNLEEVTMIVTLPIWSPSALIENTAILLMFLRNAAPDWPQSIDWLQDSLERIIDKEQERAIISKNGRTYTLTILDVLDAVVLQVKPA